MAFGKNKKQNEEAIHPNNYCGGFAMCAILNDMAGSESNAPMDIYNEIQTQHQQQLPASLARLVENMGAAGNNTSICLPSSLVLLLSQKDWLPKSSIPRILTLHMMKSKRRKGAAA